MALRKPFVMSSEGFQEEIQPSDSLDVGAITINASGAGIDSGGKKITNLGDATADGDALAYLQSGAELADLTISSGGDIAVSGGGELTGLPSTPSGATAATSKSYVDGLIDGLAWVDTCATIGLVGNATVATINGLSPSAGDAYVMTDAGTLTAGSLSVSAGDMVEYDGSSWVKIVANSGGYPPSGTRAVLSTATALVSPYTDATDDGKIMEFGGSSLTGAATGDAVNHAAFLVQTPNNDGYYENQGYTFEGTVPTGTWVQWTGAASVNAGDGLTKTGNTINVGAGNGISVAADSVAVDPDSETGGNTQPVSVGANGVGLDVSAIAGTGIEADGSANLRLATQGNGIAGGAGTTLSVDPDSESGGNIEPVTVGANGVGLDVSSIAGTNLEADGSANLRIAATAAGDGLTGGGANPLAVNLEATNPSLQISSDELGVKIKPSGGLAVDGSGLYVSGSDEATKVENSLTTATDATTNGDPVYANGTDTVGQADAATDAKARVLGVIRSGGGAAGSTVEVVTAGPCAGVLSGATPNTPYYLQSGGGIGASLPGASTRVICVGYAINATDLFVRLVDYGKKAP